MIPPRAIFLVELPSFSANADGAKLIESWYWPILLFLEFEFTLYSLYLLEILLLVFVCFFSLCLGLDDFLYFL